MHEKVTHHAKTRLLIEALSMAWAIDEDWLRKMYAIAFDREAAAEYAALMAKSGTPLSYTYRAEKRGNVGIIPIQGPIFPKANMMTELSGATSLEMIIRDAAAMDDAADIEHIVFKSDSPGGVVTGMDEGWQFLRNMKTPTHMHATGACASACYWLGSGMNKISASPASLIGSLGVMMSMEVPRKGENLPGPETLRFVSSVSPKKNLDPSTDEGAEDIQRIVNGLAGVFMDNVAQGRKTSLENIAENYGKGSVLLADAALAVGMIDSVTTFEALLAELSGQEEHSSYGDSVMNYDEFKAKYPDLFDKVRAEGADSAKASAQTETTRLAAENDAIKQENTTLKAEIDKSQTINGELVGRVAALEKKDIIRAENDTKTTAGNIQDKLLAGSSISPHLYTKVKAQVNYSNFVAEGVFKAEEFTTAMKDEIKDWEKSLGAASTNIGGFGVVPVEENDDTADGGTKAAAVADNMFNLLGTAVKGGSK